MEKAVYTEEVITSMPNSSFIHEHIQTLREDLERLEAEKDEMLILLHGVADAEGSEELEEVLLRVKEFIENRAYPTPY